MEENHFSLETQTILSLITGFLPRHGPRFSKIGNRSAKQIDRDFQSCGIRVLEFRILFMYYYKLE